ncbi:MULTISPECIES: TadE family type IV pilus minor pilin [Frankia]|uniref:TadE family type IV pilus minor pilin n=1 Tax=Frankia TaxID=1854 RepID=UPI001F486C31|nr:MULTISPECIES: TadE family type IV pilus minor pilin [Frankia]
MPCGRRAHPLPHPPTVARHRRDITRGADSGQATAELAVGLPSVFVAFFLAAWMLATVGAQARCADAARVGARLAARGEAQATVSAAVTRAAPRGATLRLHRDADLLDVEVSAPVGAAGLGRLVPALVVTAHAVTPVEPVACTAPDCAPPGPP